MDKYLKILLNHKDRFDALDTFFAGHSRILKNTDFSDLLLCKLIPSVFSIKVNNSVFLNGIDAIRSRMNDVLATYLQKAGILTSTLCTKDEYILIKKYQVAPIEVIVKGAMIGSPKHIYKGIVHTNTRFGYTLSERLKHEPYVRFDWRNFLPEIDQCMPIDLANYFIDVQQAENTALKVFNLLNQLLHLVDLDLLDICFFMNEEGNVICGEISTDNSRIIYTGCDPNIKEVFTSDDVLKRAQTILELIETAGNYDD